MNILRTIQKQEEQWWIDLLFEKGPHEFEYAPCYPPRFPFPFQLRTPVKGGYLYLVYQGEIIGFGRIEEVEDQQGRQVGSHGQNVTAGSNIILAGPLRKMPASFQRIRCKGFQGIRYTAKRLHTLSEGDARAEIRRLKLEPEK